MDRRIDRTRRALKAALLERSLERRPEELSVAELAEAADINRVTFYAHYASVDALIEETLLDILARIESVQRPPELAPDEDPRELVVGNLRAALDALMERAGFIRWALGASRGSAFRRAMADGVRSLIARRAAALGARSDSPAARVYLDYAAEGCAGAILRWIEALEGPDSPGVDAFAPALALALSEHPYAALGIGDSRGIAGDSS